MTDADTEMSVERADHLRSLQRIDLVLQGLSIRLGDIEGLFLAAWQIDAARAPENTAITSLARLGAELARHCLNDLRNHQAELRAQAIPPAEGNH